MTQLFFKRNLFITLMLTKDLADKRFEVGNLRVNEIKVIATVDEKLFWNACFVTRQLKMKSRGYRKVRYAGGAKSFFRLGKSKGKKMNKDCTLLVLDSE